jgi:hypothetical protein
MLVFSLQAKDGKSVAIIDLLGLLVDCIEDRGSYRAWLRAYEYELEK